MDGSEILMDSIAGGSSNLKDWSVARSPLGVACSLLDIVVVVLFGRLGRVGSLRRGA